MSEQEFVIQDSWGDHLIAKKTADGGATLEYNNRSRSADNPNRFGQLTATDIVKLGKFFRGEIGGFSCDGLVTAETLGDNKVLRVGNRSHGSGGFFLYWTPQMMAVPIKLFTVDLAAPAVSKPPVTAVSMKLIDDWGDELTIESADGVTFRLAMKGHPRSWEPLGSENIDIPKAELVAIRDALLSRGNHPRISWDGTKTWLLTGSINAGFRGSGINKLSAFITSCLSPYETQTKPTATKEASPVMTTINASNGRTLTYSSSGDNCTITMKIGDIVIGERTVPRAKMLELCSCIVNRNDYNLAQNDNFRSFDSYGSHCYIGLPAKLGGGHESARFNEGADRDALVAFAQAIGKAYQPVLVDPVGATSTITGFDGKVLAITPTKTGWFAKIGSDGPSINMTDADFERVRRGVDNGNDTGVNDYRVVDSYSDKIYFRAPGFPSDRVGFRTGASRNEFKAFMLGLSKTPKPAPAPYGFTVTGTDGDSLEVSGSGDAWKVNLRDEDGDTNAKHTFTRDQILRIAEGVRMDSDRSVGDLSRVVDTYAGKIYIRLGDYGEQVKFKRTELSALKSEFAKLETHLGVAVTVQNSGLSTPASAAAAAVQEQVNILSPITTQNWRGRGSIQTLVGCAGEVGLEVTQGDKTVELTLTLTQARQLVAKLNAAINN